MAREDVQVEGGENGVAHAVLLDEEAGIADPGSGAYHAPHSSTTSAIFFSGSYLSMIAECFAMRLSMSSVDLQDLGVIGPIRTLPTAYDGGHYRTTV